MGSTLARAPPTLQPRQQFWDLTRIEIRSHSAALELLSWPPAKPVRPRQSAASAPLGLTPSDRTQMGSGVLNLPLHVACVRNCRRSSAPLSLAPQRKLQAKQTPNLPRRLKSSISSLFSRCSPCEGLEKASENSLTVKVNSKSRTFFGEKMFALKPT